MIKPAAYPTAIGCDALGPCIHNTRLDYVVTNVAARIARTGRRVVLHLPRDWPWADSWHRLHEIAAGPPPAAAS